MVQSCPTNLEAKPNLDKSNEDQAWSIPRGKQVCEGRSHGSSGNQTSGKATAQHTSYTEASEQETSSESEEQQEDQDEMLTMAREEARMCEHFTRLALPYKSSYPEESTQELNQAMVSKHAHLASWHADTEKHIMIYYDLKMQSALTMKVQDCREVTEDFVNTCKGYDRSCIEEEKAKKQQEKMRREVRARCKKYKKYIRSQEQSLKELEEEMAEFRANTLQLMKDLQAKVGFQNFAGISKTFNDWQDEFQTRIELRVSSSNTT